jgi:hypothetical protein
MAITFETIQGMVTEQLSPAIKAQSTYSATVLKKYINRGYHDFNRRCLCIKESNDITVVANQLSYTASDLAGLANVRMPYEVRYITSGSSDIGDKLSPLPGGHAALPKTKSFGRPTNYWLLGTNAKGEFEIGTWPVASSAGDTVRVWSYQWVATELVNASDVALIHDAYCDALVYYALSKINKMFSWINKDFANEAMMNWSAYMDLVQDYLQNMQVVSMDQFNTTFNTDDEDW